jgi:hypothetical protein
MPNKRTNKAPRPSGRAAERADYATWKEHDKLDVGVTHQLGRIERVIVQLPERVIEHDDTSREK